MHKVTLKGYSVVVGLFENPVKQTKVLAPASLEPEIRRVMFTVQGHMTLTYKVTLKGYRVVVCLFEILDLKNL